MKELDFVLGASLMLRNIHEGNEEVFVKLLWKKIATIEQNMESLSDEELRTLTHVKHLLND